MGARVRAILLASGLVTATPLLSACTHAVPSREIPRIQMGCESRDDTLANVPQRNRIGPAQIITIDDDGPAVTPSGYVRHRGGIIRVKPPRRYVECVVQNVGSTRASGVTIPFDFEYNPSGVTPQTVVATVHTIASDLDPGSKFKLDIVNDGLVPVYVQTHPESKPLYALDPRECFMNLYPEVPPPGMQVATWTTYMMLCKLYPSPLPRAASAFHY